MEFNGKLITKLPIQSGTTPKGDWKKQDAIFETKEQFAKKVCVTFFGEKVDELAKLKEGDEPTVYVNIESREYNGKWYTTIHGWKMEVKTSAPSKSQPEDFNNDPNPPF